MNWLRWLLGPRSSKPTPPRVVTISDRHPEPKPERRKLTRAELEVRATRARERVRTCRNEREQFALSFWCYGSYRRDGCIEESRAAFDRAVRARMRHNWQRLP